MLDENEHSRKEDGRSLHRLLHKAEQQDATVVVDSAAFFSELPPEQAPPPRRPQQNTRRNTAGGENGAYQPPKRGKILLIVQAILSVLALVQLWRTQMLPVLYLVILAALLALLWLLVKRCQEYNVPGKVARVFSVFLCAAMALGCFWAQQGLSALGSMTSGLLTGAEANKITKEPFVIYLSGVDTRGELTENARSDVNILAAVNPVTKRVALINTPRDYYVDLAGTDSKDKLTHAGLYGVETSMATLGNLYGVNVDHYIRINFAGFISIIDALGGVDVYSDQAFTSVGSPGYYDPTTFVEGWNHLDGKAALAFARERHAFASGDIQRGINQMKVIDAMLNKIKSPALLMGFSKIMDAAADCFVTSFSQDQISALVRMQLSDFAEWDIESYTVTGTSSSSTKCYIAMGLSNGAILLFLHKLIGIYALSGETMVLSELLVRIHAGFAILLWTLSFVLPNALRAANDVKFTMIVSILSMAVWRLGFSYLLCVRMGWGAVGVWIAMIIDWVCRVTCFVLRFRSGVWKTKYQA